jgi:DNA-binding NtrC family response regulator
METNKMPAVMIAVAFSKIDLRLIREILSPYGIDMVGVREPHEAFRQKTEPGVIFYDADGPEDWRDTLDLLLRRWPGSRVVIISRVADEQMWTEALAAGAYDLNGKPFRPADVVRVAQGALSKTTDQNWGSPLAVAGGVVTAVE